ncbi:MAG TPA: hypothetical protein DCG47_11300, partial [Spirochaetaceae bacterium]|nr:hypothetical protein [Spirochaetaceae bacterium]
MPLRRPRRFTAFIVTLTLFALAILALVLWRSLGPDEPDNSLAALAVPARELAAARAALEDAGLSGSIISSYDTQLVVSDFSRLIYLSAADAFRRISSSDPRRTPLIDALERAFYIRIGDDTWTTLYTARRGDSLEQASLALRAQAIPVLSSIGAPSSPGLSVSRLSWLLSLALGLYFVAAKPRHDLRYRLLLVLSGAPLMLSASVESLLTALAFISCAKTVYDRYPLRATDEGRLVMAIGRRMPFLALIAPYVF